MVKIDKVCLKQLQLQMFRQNKKNAYSLANERFFYFVLKLHLHVIVPRLFL